MARKHTEDRIAEFLKQRGDSGASSQEIAAAFMNMANVPPIMADKIIRPLLGMDARFHQDADGRWHADEPSPRAPTTYTVTEFLFAPGANVDHVPIECGVARLHDDRIDDTVSTPMQPEFPLAPALELPEGLTREALNSAPESARVLERLHASARGTTMVSFQHTPLHAKVCHADPARPLPHLSTKKLARRLGLIPRGATLRDCAEALSVFLPQPSRAAERAAASAQMLQVLLARLEEQGIRGRSQVDEFLVREYIDVDFSGREFDTTYLETLPDAPGIYIMQDANGAPIYVGKAKNLRQRVGSYFRRKVREDERVLRIRERAVSLSIEQAGSELEAILLEQRRIRELAPELNQQLDVHERPERLQREPNLIIILPSVEPDCAELLLVMEGARLAQVRVPRDASDEAAEALRGAYFGPTAPELIGGEDDIELVWTWLAGHRDDASSINVEAAAGMDHVMRLLADHLAHDEPGEGRTYRV